MNGRFLSEVCPSPAATCGHPAAQLYVASGQQYVALAALPVFVGITNKLAIQSVQLPGDFHPDSADRMITALARHYSAMLVTNDDKIRNYRHVKTIW